MIEKKILEWIEEAEAVTENEEGNVFGSEDLELQRLRDLVADIKLACQRVCGESAEKQP